MDFNFQHLKDIFQATAPELSVLKKDLPSDGFLNYYTDVLISYLSGDTNTLKELAGHAAKFNDHALQSIVDLRLAIRENSVTEKLITDTISLCENNPYWKAESLILAGFASEALTNFHSAKFYYYESFKEFDKKGVRVKALKALHNYISASSKIDPERAYFAEFHMIIRKARAIRQLDIAGSALNNLAREFQKLKAYKTALRYSNKAMTVLQGAAGTYHHHMALINRCHILCDLQRFDLANEDLKILLASPYSEVQSGLKILEDIIVHKKKEVVSSAAPTVHPTWIERLAQGPNQEEPLSDLEDRVLVLLSCKPRDKYFLMKDLYGEFIDPAASENRLKNVINRLRKKRPGKIIFESGLYHLDDGTQMNIG